MTEILLKLPLKTMALTLSLKIKLAIKLKTTKKCHTVGKAPKSKPKIVETARKSIPPNTINILRADMIKTIAIFTVEDCFIG